MSMSNMFGAPLRVSHHARVRYAETYLADSDDSILQRLYYNSVEVSLEEASKLSWGYPQAHNNGRDRYFLPADASGLFVVRKDKMGRSGDWIIVTFLRFKPDQEAAALEILRKQAG